MDSQQDQSSEFEFFQQAVSHISSSLDLSQSMVRVFAFLKDHFPIDGISLHQYSHRLKALKLLFLVTEDRFQYVETTLKMSKRETIFMQEHEAMQDPIIMSDKVSNKVADKHRHAISHLLPYRPSSYLVGIMQSGETPVGHLCLIGSGLVDYTEEQGRKMELLLSPFTLAMSNMLQFKRVMEFQENLYSEKSSLEKTLDQLRDSLIIGERGGLKNTMNIVNQLKDKETPVLILGETGTGKELIADAIQKISPRAGQSFIKVNCGAIPDSLIDSELFGYEKGAFTGASKSHQGRFEQAHGGTLFLDEVGELPAQAQVRLLRVLQNNVVERIGGKNSIPVNVRIIAATNRDLGKMLQDGTFREDLYYRLYVFPIQIPPLRERGEDLPALIHHFIEKSCLRLKLKTSPVIHPDSFEKMKQYTWPGNVRELENMVERAVILSPDDYLKLDHFLSGDPDTRIVFNTPKNDMESLIDKKIQAAFDKYFNGNQKRIKKVQTNCEIDHAIPHDQIPIPSTSGQIQALNETIKESIQAALLTTRGRVNGPGGAAQLLGLNPSTLRNKIRKLGIDASDWR